MKNEKLPPNPLKVEFGSAEKVPFRGFRGKRNKN
jgi:hypothetical protein